MTKASLLWGLERIGASLILVLLSSAGVAENLEAPAAKAVIYPGDVIRDDMLVNVPLEDGAGAFVSAAEVRKAIVGKLARRTLLPGEPLGISDAASPRVIVNGGEVTLVYVDDGLMISISASALQDGSPGDMIRVRNNDSGVIISGAVQPDGSVRVYGGG